MRGARTTSIARPLCTSCRSSRCCARVVRGRRKFGLHVARAGAKRRNLRGHRIEPLARGWSAPRHHHPLQGRTHNDRGTATKPDCSVLLPLSRFVFEIAGRELLITSEEVGRKGSPAHRVRIRCRVSRAHPPLAGEPVPRHRSCPRDGWAVSVGSSGPQHPKRCRGDAVDEYVRWPPTIPGTLQGVPTMRCGCPCRTH